MQCVCFLYSLHLSFICPFFQSFILSPVFLAISFIHSSIYLLFQSSFTIKIVHSFIHLTIHASSLNSFILISIYLFFCQLLKSFAPSHIILFVVSFINLLPLFIYLLCFSGFLSVNSRITFHLGFQRVLKCTVRRRLDLIRTSFSSKLKLKTLSRKGSNMQQSFTKRDTLLKSAASGKTKALKEIEDQEPA